jgi:glucosamine-6-phosphate deaminase
LPFSGGDFVDQHVVELISKAESQDVICFTLGKVRAEIHPDKKAAGAAAAQAVAEEIRRLNRLGAEIAVIFATGASQIDMLDALTSISGLPWKGIQGFHLDEYVGLDENHPASFRRYLRDRLTSRVPLRAFSEINGNAEDLDAFCLQYALELRLANPQVCLLGIGENGHLAFNDPAEANFHDPAEMKAVSLDTACRQQQVVEGWFNRLGDVPQKALTLTIPAILRVPKLIVTVPEGRKAQAVLRTLEDPISTDCPSTILRSHPDVTIFLDRDSAVELTLQHPTTDS